MAIATYTNKVTIISTKIPIFNTSRVFCKRVKTAAGSLVYFSDWPGVRVPGMGGFERVDLPLPLLLQAADRRVRSSAAFGQREEPIHPLVTAPLGRVGGTWRSELGERESGEERCSTLLLRLKGASFPVDDSMFSSLLCGGAVGSTVMSLLLARRRRPAVCPQGHHASKSDYGEQLF